VLGEQPEQAERGGRLLAAGFTDDAEDLSGQDGEADRVDDGARPAMSASAPPPTNELVRD
jgi:hypothetical protein